MSFLFLFSGLAKVIIEKGGQTRLCCPWSSDRECESLTKDFRIFCPEGRIRTTSRVSSAALQEQEEVPKPG